MDDKLSKALFSLWLVGYREGLTGREYDFKRDRKVLEDSVIRETKDEIMEILKVLNEVANAQLTVNV